MSGHWLNGGEGSLSGLERRGIVLTMFPRVNETEARNGSELPGIHLDGCGCYTFGQIT